MRKIVVLAVLISFLLVGCSNTGKRYAPPPHEIWRVSFVDYDSNGEEKSSGIYEIVEYTKYKDSVKVVYYDDTNKKNKEVTLSVEDYIQIEVRQKFDIFEKFN